MGSLSIVDVIQAISDDKSLMLFNIIAQASGDSGILKTTLKLTRKQYYSRMSGLVNAGPVTRKNGNYFVASFGKMVYEVQLMIKDHSGGASGGRTGDTGGSSGGVVLVSGECH